MPQIIHKLLRYGLTGGVAAVVDIGGFILLIESGLAIVPAAALSFCLAAFINYHLSCRVVFKRKATMKGFSAFLSTAAVGLGVNVATTAAGVSLLGLPAVAAKIVGTGAAFFLNFYLIVRLIFA